MRPASLALVASSFLFFSVHARAEETKDACIAAFDHGQTSQSARRLKEARASLVTCSNEACPDLVREDCARSLLAVDTAMPTVVFSATKLGADRADFQVFVDGAAVDGAGGGRAVAVDPGQHSARFELLGDAPIEMPFVAHEGEKNRIVAAKFVEAEKPKEHAASQRFPIVPLALAGTGVLALGASLFFRVRADNDADDLRARCAPMCDQGSRDALSSKLVAANVALTLGIGALAVSAVTWLIDTRR